MNFEAEFSVIVARAEDGETAVFPIPRNDHQGGILRRSIVPAGPAIDALAGKQPDAALQARIKAFQTKQQTGAAELGRKQQEIQRNQQYIQQQIEIDRPLNAAAVSVALLAIAFATLFVLRVFAGRSQRREEDAQ